MERKSTEELVASLDASIASLRASTWRLGFCSVRSEKDFSRLLTFTKGIDNELPKDFIALAKEKFPQYEHIIKMFLIFD